MKVFLVGSFSLKLFFCSTDSVMKQKEDFCCYDLMIVMIYDLSGCAMDLHEGIEMDLSLIHI